MFDVNNCSDEGLRVAADFESILARLKADLAYHQSKAAELAAELDVDSEVAYSAETDAAESYHTGRVEAMSNAIDILLGREVELYSEKA